MQHKKWNNVFGVDLNNISKALDEFFTSSGIGDIFGQDAENQTPLTNVYEYEDRTVIELAAPGLVKSDFVLNVENDHLIIEVQKEAEHKSEENVKVKRKEFDYSTFKRSFRLIEEFDAQRITAKYESGILYITAPKRSTDTDQSIKIEVL